MSTKKTRSRKGKVPTKVCPKCESFCPNGCKTCPECAHVFAHTKKKAVKRSAAQQTATAGQGRTGTVFSKLFIEYYERMEFAESFVKSAGGFKKAERALQLFRQVRRGRRS